MYFHLSPRGISAAPPESLTAHYTLMDMADWYRLYMCPDLASVTPQGCWSCLPFPGLMWGTPILELDVDSEAGGRQVLDHQRTRVGLPAVWSVPHKDKAEAAKPKRCKRTTPRVTPDEATSDVNDDASEINDESGIDDASEMDDEDVSEVNDDDQGDDEDDQQYEQDHTAAPADSEDESDDD